MGFYRLAVGMSPESRYWRRTLIGYLRDRDGDACGICGRKTIRWDLPSGPKGDDRGASIDHIVPRSKGGSDGLENLRLTHWGCNRNRRAGGGNEQLLLVG